MTYEFFKKRRKKPTLHSIKCLNDDTSKPLTMENSTDFISMTNMSTSNTDSDVSFKVLVAVYSVIFVLAVVGNILVILTLVQNTRMRTVTNVFLLNLAISDLLLAVFCMPFTLIPILIKNFIFGPFICVSIRYAQGKMRILLF